MPATYDVILKGGTVVNQDGVGERDIGLSGGRIAAIGSLSAADAGETVDCRGFMCCLASSTVRCISASLA